MFHPNHLISPGCPRPNSALIVQKRGLKHRSSIHPLPFHWRYCNQVTFMSVMLHLKIYYSEHHCIIGFFVSHFAQIIVNVWCIVTMYPSQQAFIYVHLMWLCTIYCQAAVIFIISLIAIHWCDILRWYYLFNKYCYCTCSPFLKSHEYITFLHELLLNYS